MLEGITWKTYITVIIITVVIYYAFIGLLYFRPELKKILGRKAEDSNEEFIDVGGVDELQKIMNDIKQNILEQAGEEATKEQLLTQFADKLANYGRLSQPAYQDTVNGFLIRHTQMICGITLSEEELRETWKGLAG